MKSKRGINDKLNEAKREMIKVAYYYYKMQYNQQEIAEKFNISRQKVNRLIKRALDEGIIEIKIDGYESFNIKLEDELERKYKLKEALVVEALDNDQLFKSSSKYLTEIIKYYCRENNKCSIGVSWGEALNGLLKYMDKVDVNNTSVVQLVGGMNTNDIEIKPEEITNKLAMSINGKAYNLFLPAAIQNKKIKELLLEEEYYKQTISRFNDVDVAIVGIGQLTNDSTLLKQGHMDEYDLNTLIENGAAGEICLRAFDINGNILNQEINEKIMGIEPECFKNIETKIGIAYGENKVKAIIGAISGGFIDILITDEKTARLIINN